MRGKKDIEYYISLGKKIREIKKRQGLSQKEVAKILGVTFQQYQKYERGINRIPIKALVTFCELTNSDIKELTACDINKKIEDNNINIDLNNNSFVSYSIAKLVYSNKKIKMLLEFDLNQKYVKEK